METLGENSWRLHLDGPLSLFSATQKYGLQLALFFPAVLLCRDFEVRAELRWGPQRKPKVFQATPSDGLVSHYADSGTYVPPELGLFVELFRKRIADWDILEETEVFPLGIAGFWVPDFRLLHKETGQRVCSRYSASGGAPRGAAFRATARSMSRSRSCWRCRINCTSRRRSWKGLPAGDPSLSQYAAAG